MSLKPELITWLAGFDTGRSSLGLLAWMERDLSIEAMLGNRLDYPRDPSDLGRCIRLMDIEPSYRTRIREMSAVSPEWGRLAGRWAELEALYREEEPSERAPKCYERMQELISGSAKS